MSKILYDELEHNFSFEMSLNNSSKTTYRFVKLSYKPESKDITLYQDTPHKKNQQKDVKILSNSMQENDQRDIKKNHQSDSVIHEKNTPSKSKLSKRMKNLENYCVKCELSQFDRVDNIVGLSEHRAERDLLKSSQMYYNFKQSRPASCLPSAFQIAESIQNHRIPKVSKIKTKRDFPSYKKVICFKRFQNLPSLILNSKSVCNTVEFNHFDFKNAQTKEAIQFQNQKAQRPLLVKYEFYGQESLFYPSIKTNLIQQADRKFSLKLEYVAQKILAKEENQVSAKQSPSTQEMEKKLHFQLQSSATSNSTYLGTQTTAGHLLSVIPAMQSTSQAINKNKNPGLVYYYAPTYTPERTYLHNFLSLNYSKNST